MKIIVNSDYSGVDEIINSIDNLLSKNGFDTQIDHLTISFFRKTDKRADRLMPIKEIIKGINEGKLTVQQEKDKIIINCQFKWFLHSFTTILLIGIFCLLFCIATGFDNALNNLLIASLIFLPLSIIGIFAALRHFRNIILYALRKTGLDNKLIESS
jgi:hypothetical protein